MSRLNYLSHDEKTRELYRVREKARLDAINARVYAEKKGRAEEKLEIAKKMLLKGIDIEEIAEITALSLEQLNELKN